MCLSLQSASGALLVFYVVSFHESELGSASKPKQLGHARFSSM